MFSRQLASIRSSKACFYRKNLYEGSYARPYEGLNAGLNEIPNDDMNKNCGIISLMIKIMSRC